MLPTLIDLARLKKPSRARFDGASLAGLLRGRRARLRDRSLVVQYSRMDHAPPYKGHATVMWNKWRLVQGRELYDLRSDPGQQHDVSDAQPAIVKRLRNA